MDVICHYTTRTRPCAYLPNMAARMEHEAVSMIAPSEYLALLEAGWRRFGRTLFRPTCSACSECRSLRVDVQRFQPTRSMKRVHQKNQGKIDLTIVEAQGAPKPEVLDLYNRYHREQHRLRAWEDHDEDPPEVFQEAFLENPLPTEQWEYRLEGRLVGVGYVDVLPEALSAIYFVYDHESLDRSPGTWNILRLLERAKDQRCRHVYLGYFVEECRSLSYKQRFRPNEIFRPDGAWHPFRS